MIDIPKFKDLLVKDKPEVRGDKYYRYIYAKKWGADYPPCVFVMLNPVVDMDALTIENCETIALDDNKQFFCNGQEGIVGHRSGIICVNLFAHFADSGDDLKKLAEKNKNLNIIGPRNDEYLISALSEPEALIIVAWGEGEQNRNARFRKAVGFQEQIDHVSGLMREHAANSCVLQLEEKNKPGIITHPSWLQGNYELARFF